jgi:hypothetical protein
MTWACFERLPRTNLALNAGNVPDDHTTGQDVSNMVS